MCERAAGRGKVGGATQLKRQQSQDQSTTTAMIKETLRKESISALPASPSLSVTDFQFKPTLTAGSSLPNSGPTNLSPFDSFEVNTAQREAEEQLELLMMEDEMRDLRISATISENTSTQCVPSLTSNGSGIVGTSTECQSLSGTSTASHQVPLSNADPHPVSSVPTSLSGDSHGVSSAGVGSRAPVTTAGLGGVRSQQLTVDSKEKERLEDIMAVAQ